MDNLNIIFVLLTALVGASMFWRSNTRSAKDVLQDINEHASDSVALDSDEIDLNSDDKLQKKKLEMASMGIFDREGQRKFELRLKLVPVYAILAVLVIRLAIGAASFKGLLLCLLFGFAVGVIATSFIKRRAVARYRYDINFYLPLVMERLVMAVQAGLDILPAIGVILRIESQKTNNKKVKLDPVTELLGRVSKLSDAGLSFEKSLHQVAESVDNSALRHSFIHLAMAYKDGGELVAPLRELSDSTQLFFQETIEEEIAKMPVKATMPLLLTFAGLILCFLTSPAIQITEIMGNAMPNKSSYESPK